MHYTYACKCLRFVMLCAPLGGSRERSQKYLRGQPGVRILCYGPPHIPLKSWCHTQRRAGTATHAHPSFGMTTTQDIRDLFAWRCPILHDVLTVYLFDLFYSTSHIEEKKILDLHLECSLNYWKILQVFTFLLYSGLGYGIDCVYVSVALCIRGCSLYVAYDVLEATDCSRSLSTA